MYYSDFEKEILDMSMDMYYFCGFENYEIKYINKVLCHFLEIDINGCIGKKCYEVIYKQERPCHWCLNAELQYESMKISSIETTYTLNKEQFQCSIFTVNQDDEEIHVTRFFPNKNDCYTSHV